MSNAERCLNAPHLSDTDGFFVKIFCNHVTTFLKVEDHGNNLEELIKQKYDFYKATKVR